MKAKKVGLFFGSFNPVHIGHTAVAGYLAEFTELDEVWMVLSPHNPLKEKASLLKDYHRMAMLQLAVEDFPRLKTCDLELKMPQPSYTINTLLHLREKFPSHSFHPIIGSDNLLSFHKWKNHEEIINQFGIIVYPRPGYPLNNEMKQNSVIFVDNAPQMEISASFIRHAVKDGKNVNFLLLPKVYKYMDEMNFYKT
ncbi:MAG: nicotinate (nicotinamide) nucleotide adenylyltransferase [Flavobacteriales bacterium]